ncbi:hypothetical protein Emag_007103 [Eimeria magna]
MLRARSHLASGPAKSLSCWPRVQSQEVAALEAGAADLQQQQQQLQQRRLKALPALEDATVQEDRQKLMQHMATDGDRLLDDLKQFHKAKENSWPSPLPTLKAQEKCRDLWASLKQVKASRMSAAEALTAKLNDALGEARKAIDEHVRARQESEGAINELIWGCMRAWSMQRLQDACVGLWSQDDKGSSARGASRPECMQSQKRRGGRAAVAAEQQEAAGSSRKQQLA